MLRKSSPPIVPRRARRADDRDRARLEERPQRGGDRDVVALVDARAVALGRRRSGTRTSTTPPSSARGDARSRRPRTRASIGRFSGSTSATKRSMPTGRRALGELLEQPRADAAALQLVGDGERDLGDRRVAQPRRSSRAPRSARRRPRRRACRRARRARPSRGRASARRAAANRRLAGAGSLVGTLVRDGSERIVAHRELIAPARPAVAEVAFAVADELQGRGVGTRLLEQLASTARPPG